MNAYEYLTEKGYDGLSNDTTIKRIRKWSWYVRQSLGKIRAYLDEKSVEYMSCSVAVGDKYSRTGTIQLYNITDKFFEEVVWPWIQGEAEHIGMFADFEVHPLKESIRYKRMHVLVFKWHPRSVDAEVLK